MLFYCLRMGPCLATGTVWYTMPGLFYIEHTFSGCSLPACWTPPTGLLEHFSWRQSATKQLAPVSYTPEHAETDCCQSRYLLQWCLSFGRDCRTSVLQRHSKTKSCWWVLCLQGQRWGQCSLRLEPGKAGAQLRAGTPDMCSATPPLSHRNGYLIAYILHWFLE